MVIRFLDSTKTVREEFVGWNNRNSYQDLITVVADLGLSMDDCRDQCYDARLLRHRKANF